MINNNVNDNLFIENNKLKTELNTYKQENEKLKNRIQELNEENSKLDEELVKAYMIISNKNDNQNSQQKDINEIIKLNELIQMKDNIINNLTLQIQNNMKKSVNFDDILFVHFISSIQKINCPIKCLKTDTFAEVEEQLYKQYEDYRETNNNFITKGKLVLRFKKICENGIQNGDKVQLINDSEDE